MPDWLQPCDENLVDEEEQRGDRVDFFADIQDGDQERDGVVCCTKRMSSTATSSRQRVQEHELTHIPYRSWYIAYEEQGDPMRIADEQDQEHRLRVHDWTMVICAQEWRWNELDGMGPEKQCW